MIKRAVAEALNEQASTGENIDDVESDIFKNSTKLSVIFDDNLILFLNLAKLIFFIEFSAAWIIISASGNSIFIFAFEFKLDTL